MKRSSNWDIHSNVIEIKQLVLFTDNFVSWVVLDVWIMDLCVRGHAWKKEVLPHAVMNGQNKF